MKLSAIHLAVIPDTASIVFGPVKRTDDGTDEGGESYSDRGLVCDVANGDETFAADLACLMAAAPDMLRQMLEAKHLLASGDYRGAAEKLASGIEARHNPAYRHLPAAQQPKRGARVARRVARRLVAA